LCLLLKKVASLFCPGEARETPQIYSRTYKQNSRTFQDSKKIQDFSACGNPEYKTYDKKYVPIRLYDKK